MGRTGSMDMSEEARSRRAPSTASMLFFGFLAALGLLGATRAGDHSARAPTPGTSGAHLTWAKDYREKATAAQREVELHRSVADGTRAARDEAFRIRCLRLAAAAAELAKAENDLADYHEAQARGLPTVAAETP